MLEITILVLYTAGLCFIFFFCVSQLSLAILYFKYKKDFRQYKNSNSKLESYPLVTVQLPIFNELYVVERLIDAIANFDYPKDRFEIQVLDDSTDETVELSKRKVEAYRKQDFNIKLITRKDRVGYKAGALQEGLKTATGEFICIFDADFIPQPDFLLKTLPYFQNEKIGMVQTKWLHINKSYSVLTRVQAFALDAHFNIEQNGRSAAGVFMNFNGTAGVWRKSCIEDAGGWSHDTLTEDLDLSYRAQLKGWKFLFVRDVGAPAELPAAMGAIKSQQYRWSKGPAEVTKKLLGQVLSSKVSWKVKWLSFFHLMNSSINIFILVTAVLSVPLLFIKANYDRAWPFSFLYLFYTGIVAISIMYFISQVVEEKGLRKGAGSFLWMFPTFLSLSMGLSLHNGLAALRGFLGKKTAFIRTPKHSIVTAKDSWKNKKYAPAKIDWLSVIEFFMAAYFFFGMVLSVYYQQYEMLVFHFLLFIGFLSISFFSIKHALVSAAKG